MKPFEWICLDQNLHSIHHPFPQVPFYRYHKFHREIEPIIGIFSRKSNQVDYKESKEIEV